MCKQDELLQAVEAIGFESKLLGSDGSSTLRLRIGGLTCSSCSLAIEAALRARSGVGSASVSLLTNTAEVQIYQTSDPVLTLESPTPNQ
jgi:Cu+-exporting ATPase